MLGDMPGYCNDPNMSLLADISPWCWPDTSDATFLATLQKAAGAGTANYNPDLAASEFAAYLQDKAALDKLQAGESNTTDYMTWVVVGVGALVVILLVRGK